jgi:Ser/Thr protein kinase RdoA (MazF antagonist)
VGILASDTVNLPASATDQQSADCQFSSQILKLSESRTSDRALITLCAYESTGNFSEELEMVLRDMRVLRKVAYEIKPKQRWSDSRQVEFQARAGVRHEEFCDIVRRIRNEVGIAAQKPFWQELFS